MLSGILISGLDVTTVIQQFQIHTSSGILKGKRQIDSCIQGNPLQIQDFAHPYLTITVIFHTIQHGPQQWVYDVPPSLGLIHHYRKVYTEKRLEKCGFNHTSWEILDTTTKTFERNISSHVEKAAKYLKLV